MLSVSFFFVCIIETQRGTLFLNFKQMLMFIRFSLFLTLEQFLNFDLLFSNQVVGFSIKCVHTRFYYKSFLAPEQGSQYVTSPELGFMDAIRINTINII